MNVFWFLFSLSFSKYICNILHIIYSNWWQCHHCFFQEIQKELIHVYMIHPLYLNQSLIATIWPNFSRRVYYFCSQWENVLYCMCCYNMYIYYLVLSLYFWAIHCKLYLKRKPNGSVMYEGGQHDLVVKAPMQGSLRYQGTFAGLCSPMLMAWVQFSVLARNEGSWPQLPQRIDV